MRAGGRRARRCGRRRGRDERHSHHKHGRKPARWRAPRAPASKSLDHHGPFPLCAVATRTLHPTDKKRRALSARVPTARTPPARIMLRGSRPNDAATAGVPKAQGTGRLESRPPRPESSLRAPLRETSAAAPDSPSNACQPAAHPTAGSLGGDQRHPHNRHRSRTSAASSRRLPRSWRVLASGIPSGRRCRHHIWRRQTNRSHGCESGAERMAVIAATAEWLAPYNRRLLTDDRLAPRAPHGRFPPAALVRAVVAARSGGRAEAHRRRPPC